MFTVSLRSLLMLMVALLFQAVAAPVAARAAPPAGKAQMLRTWTDSSGAHKIRARLVEVVDKQVQLKKSDGTVISVPLEKLSELDQKWLAKWAPAAGSGHSADGEWPGWRGPNRDGRSPDKGLLRQWPPEGPKLLWKAGEIGKGFSGVAVAGGTIYITGDVGGTLVIFAFDLDGKPKWRVEHGPDYSADHPGARATPTIDGGNLYLLSGVGALVCYDAQNGQRKWGRTAEEFGGKPGHWGYAESVLIYENLAIFKPGGRSCIVALDKASGRPVWTSQGVVAGPEYSSCLALDFQNVPMIVTGTREGIACVSSRNGAMLWGNPFSAQNTANCPTPAYSDGYVFWANGYNKGGICLRLGPGNRASEAWTTKDMNCHHGGYIIDNGYIYGNNGNRWTCLELKTGKKQWDDKGDVGKGSLCWADGMLYLFGEKDGQAALATCSPEGLKIQGHVKVEGDGPSWAHPVVIGGRLYLRYDTTLYCFDVKAKAG
jgi:outer membrane protein assembly factor BamB